MSSSNDYWKDYDPSVAFAVAGTILFAIVFMWAFVFGTLLEVVGYIFRIMSANDHYSKGKYAVQLVLLIVAPAFFAATCYMIYGRLLIVHDLHSVSFLPKKIVTPLFVSVDVLSFLIQVGGGVLFSSDNPSTVQTGSNVLKGGYVVQLVGNALFILTGATVVFVRTLYRFLQIIVKNSNGDYPLQMYEWEFIVFDFLFMLPLTIYFALSYPSKNLEQAESSYTKESNSVSPPTYGDYV
ncbi:hypothetical protein MNV49_007347 [Pseudohyphozyma bogoriensis]|nr:hypothetical protein MNV49_007347 [Pseudohyphozyma bogoriensis]